MPETEGLMQGLKDSGCSQEAAARICSLRGGRLAKLKPEYEERL